ncbi:CDP-glycerol glycerophosphotransferase family protein [Streptomyces cyaneofuscatus]|uniref:CDP-glycerol glycerophosphotransferase family protein n=1 Tax=Streptomyces TaxID=1883 RepID=UPI002E11C0CC|nr:CDP-glycerol glycerophosphotransferase family protein [Streptomyces cyaneofuscatus]WSI50503.1 CDP-glycerol glycerophosphotransferase family protein [Streptomyces cyaneofuscatus]WTF35491.1 CDP-glycerol glycerophosphotransferase family protein [Streptomyces cyaneofuscatus]
MNSQQIDAEHHRLDINVTNFRDRRQVPNGTWRIVPVIDDERLPEATFDLKTADRLDSDSRTFLYDQNRSVYVIAFGISDDEDHPAFLMRTYQLFRGGGAKKPAKKKPIGKRIALKVVPRARRRKLANKFYRTARRLNPPKGNRILFASEMRTGLGGNLARVHDRMIERGLDKKHTFNYSFRVPATANKWSTLRLIYRLATSDTVLMDDYFGLLANLNISPDTKIIQLWHAGSGFKAVGYSRFGKYGSPKLSNAHRKYTYVITGSKHLVPVYAEAFGIEESAVVPTGLPRIDTFLNEDHSQKVKDDFFASYPHLKGKKIVLFAPTFRGKSIGDAHYDYDRIDFEKLHEVCGDKYVVLFRMHHFISEEPPIPAEYADRLINFAEFPDTNDLLHVTDVLVTDYSSVIYEYTLLDKPILFYAYDKDTYSVVRGFHRDYDAVAPGKVCVTFDELLKSLQDEDFDLSKVEEFRQDNFDYVDTNSADRVIDWLVVGDHGNETGGFQPWLAPVPDDTAVGDQPLSDQSEE